MHSSRILCKMVTRPYLPVCKTSTDASEVHCPNLSGPFLAAKALVSLLAALQDVPCAPAALPSIRCHAST